MGYITEYGAQFPNEITFDEKLDIDDTVRTDIQGYYSALETSVSAAEEYLAEHQELLPYLIDSNFINKLSAEIYNMGLYTLTYTPTIVRDTAPMELLENGFWLKPINHQEG